MKKFLFTTTVALLCFFISCKDAATDSTNNSSSTMDSSKNNQNETNLANNRKIYKAFETGDSVTINSLIGDDAVDHQGMNGKEIRSGDSIKHMLADMHNHVKDLKIDVISEAADGDYIFTLTQMSGTTTDAMFGPPAGTKMDEKSVDVVRVKDGKMVEHWGFVDPNEMMKHMAQMPMTGKMDKMHDAKKSK